MFFFTPHPPRHVLTVTRLCYCLYTLALCKALYYCVKVNYLITTVIKNNPEPYLRSTVTSEISLPVTQHSVTADPPVHTHLHRACVTSFIKRTAAAPICLNSIEKERPVSVTNGTGQPVNMLYMKSTLHDGGAPNRTQHGEAHKNNLQSLSSCRYLQSDWNIAAFTHL